MSSRDQAVDRRTFYRVAIVLGSLPLQLLYPGPGHGRSVGAARTEQ
jgi:hypothetical protein